MDDKVNRKKDHSKDHQGDVELLQIHVRSDLYRAFRRCVWMTVFETGMSIVEVHNMLIEDLLRQKGC